MDSIAQSKKISFLNFAFIYIKIERIFHAVFIAEFS